MRTLYTIYAYLIGVPIFLMFNLTTAPVLLLTDEQNKAYLWVGKFWSTLLTRVLLLRVTVIGKQNLPTTGSGAMIISNHQSLMDIPLLLQVWQRSFSFMFKQELSEMPIFGWHVRNSANFCIERGRGESLNQLERAIKHHLSQGHDLAIFAEGTRSSNGQLQPLKRGAFSLAIKFQSAIIPVYISGSGRFKPKHGHTAWPQSITVTIHPPIIPPTISHNDADFRSASIALMKQTEVVLKTSELRMNS